MNKAATKTDNDFFKDKVILRYNNLPDKDYIKVLDCYSGSCQIWNKIKQYTDKNIEVLPIDIKKNRNNLKGDNIKFLKGMDISQFDVIDLDAYGVPFQQLEEIFTKNYKGHIFVTFIQSQHGKLNNGLLYYNGISKNMIKKVKSIFYTKGFEKFKNYLAFRGVKFIKYRAHNCKYYLFFRL